MQSPIQNQHGIALLLVLWVIVFLAVVCAEFSWTMRTETATAANFKEGMQAYYVAEAGVNRAIIELMRSASMRSSKGGGEEATEGEEAAEEDEALRWQAGGGPYRFSVGDFSCEVQVVDESNKIGINNFLRAAKKNPTNLKTFLEKHIGLEGDDRDVVADSLIDWWDRDGNVTGVNGAEDDYYESLDPPYSCRNAALPVIEECLLVRGIDERIFYGRGKKPEEKIQLTPEDLQQLMSGGKVLDNAPEEDVADSFGDNESQGLKLGIADLFSVTSTSSTFKINVNSATLEQLMLLDGMEQQTARAILAERKTGLFESTTDRLPQFANYEVWKENIKVQKPYSLSYYTLKSRGISQDGRISRSVSCSLVLSKSRCVITDWRIDG